MSKAIFNPLYRHDCQRCVHLGTFRRESHGTDVYFCSEAEGTSILLRDGDEPSDYRSFPEKVARNIAEQNLHGDYALALAMYDHALREAGWVPRRNVA